MVVSSANGRELAERGVEVGAAAVGGDRELVHPRAERVARARVERAEDLVELDRRRDLARGSAPPSGSFGGRRPAGRQLDVGLAEQRLLAQHRAGVARQRRVALVELDRRVATGPSAGRGRSS